ncbi:MAG: M23 family metallopeptidase [Oscillospiraceae bacterium]
MEGKKCRRIFVLISFAALLLIFPWKDQSDNEQNSLPLFCWPVDNAERGEYRIFQPLTPYPVPPNYVLPAKTGVPVMAAADGVVIKSEETDGYGRHIVLEHKNGYTTWYLHCSRLAVNLGDLVQTGEVIGEVGRTGHALGDALGFIVMLDGTAIDRNEFLLL